MTIFQPIDKSTDAAVTVMPAEPLAARRDLCGTPVTIASDAALSAWNATVEGVMAHAAETPNSLAAALGADPA